MHPGQVQVGHRNTPLDWPERASRCATYWCCYNTNTTYSTEINARLEQCRSMRDLNFTAPPAEHRRLLMAMPKIVEDPGGSHAFNPHLSGHAINIFRTVRVRVISAVHEFTMDESMDMVGLVDQVTCMSPMI